MLSKLGRGAAQRDVLVTGLPRSGTTLTCHLLHNLPDTVALHEPMDFHRFSVERGREQMCEDIERFLRRQRRSILEDGRAVSKHVGGKVPDNPIGTARNDQGKRQSIADKGEIAIDKPLDPDFMLVVKHNSSFTALLDSLAPRFNVFGVIRNPLAVLSSWNSVAIPVGRGHIPAAEEVDPELARRLGEIDDVIDRQIHILDWFFGRYRDLLPQGHVLRYEEVVASRGKALQVVNPKAADLDENLESRNKSKLYGADAMRSLGSRLLASEGAYWSFYPRESVEDLIRA